MKSVDPEFWTILFVFFYPSALAELYFYMTWVRTFTYSTHVHDETRLLSRRCLSCISGGIMLSSTWGEI